MNSTKISQHYFIKNSFPFFLLFLIPFNNICAQSIIKGKINSSKDGSPAAFASVKLAGKNNGTLSDSAGRFSLPAKGLKQSDTLIISLIGYETLKVPAQKALSLSEFSIQQIQKTMESVIVRSFNKEEIAGANSEIVGYFRSWNNDFTGGEIGRTFFPNHKEYQVAKVRFKVFNTYDTCIARIHIRAVNHGQIGNELITADIAQPIAKSITKETTCEFDLSKYNITLSQQNIFVGIEIIKKGQTDNTSRSLSFVGSETGNYYYKSSETDPWDSFDEYTIYMKLLLKYDD